MNELILNAVKSENWDVYRKYYPDLSVEDCIALRSSWDAQFPDQKRFDTELITESFADAYMVLTTELIKVVELGCHQGYLAREMLSLGFSIKSWVGYDINASALARSVVEDDRYTPIALDKWFYETELPDFNVFVSSHTFEHMCLKEIDKTIAHISQSAKYIILEIPIKEVGRDWKGHQSSHVLTVGRQAIRDLIAGYGFSQVADSQTNNWVASWKK